MPTNQLKGNRWKLFSACRQDDHHDCAGERLERTYEQADGSELPFGQTAPAWFRCSCECHGWPE